MFPKKMTPLYQQMIEDELVRALAQLKTETPGSEKYEKALKNVYRLRAMMTEDTSSPISKDTLIGAGTNLLGILMILRYERVDIIASKALSFVMRPR